MYYAEQTQVQTSYRVLRGCVYTRAQLLGFAASLTLWLHLLTARAGTPVVRVEGLRLTTTPRSASLARGRRIRYTGDLMRVVRMSLLYFTAKIENPLTCLLLCLWKTLSASCANLRMSPILPNGLMCIHVSTAPRIFSIST